MKGIQWLYLAQRIPVLMFHGVCERIPEYVLYPGGRTCLLSVEDFSELLKWCCQNFDVVRLADLDELLLARRSRHRPILLTFDDGLACAIDHAVPLLREHRVSAVMFVTTDWTDVGRTPDIFHLEKIVFNRIPTAMEVEIDGERIRMGVASRRQGEEAFAALWNLLLRKRLPPLQFTMGRVTLGGKPVNREEAPEDRDFWHPASWGELRAAVQKGVLEIGSHMVSHRPLTWLNGKGIREETIHSRARLEREFHCAVRACSYPHGLSNRSVAEIVAHSYAWAFSNASGTLGRCSERYHAPRVHVPAEDWTAVKHAVCGLGEGMANLKLHARQLETFLSSFANWI